MAGPLSEHPLNFASMMSLISGSDEASLCYNKISQEGELLASPELFRTKIESVSVPYTQTERMAVARHLQSFERHCRAVHMDSRAVAYARIAMSPNKVKVRSSTSAECTRFSTHSPCQLSILLYPVVPIIIGFWKWHKFDTWL